MIFDILVFQGDPNLALKSNVVNINGETLEIPSDPNPTSYCGRLTIFSDPTNLNEYFTGLV